MPNVLAYSTPQILNNVNSRILNGVIFYLHFSNNLEINHSIIDETKEKEENFGFFRLQYSPIKTSWKRGMTAEFPECQKF